MRFRHRIHIVVYTLYTIEAEGMTCGWGGVDQTRGILRGALLCGTSSLFEGK